MQIVESESAIVTFQRPPVVEVVASVRFSGLSDASTFALGEFWDTHLRPEFDTLSLQAPYEAPSEIFDPQFRGPGSPMGFEVSALPPMPRLWFTSSGGQELVQAQPNWFAVNWRRPSSGDVAYDRWPQRKASFETNWARFRKWATARGDSLVVDQCEITYINHIQPVEGVWSDHGSAGRLFPSLNGPALSGASAEQFQWQGQFRLREDSGEPPARLHVSIQPAFTGAPPQLVPVMVLQLTVRGAPTGQSDEAIVTTFKRGRDTIVQSFVELTSDEARKSWGQEE